MAGSSGFVDPTGSGRQWYDLFSRGARDWLRHNDKVRAAVRDKLPELIAGSELLPSADRTVQVPVRFLEHARFRLRDADQSEGVGQGAGKPGDQLVEPGDGALAKGAGGNEEGGYQFILELKIDDIVDWLWEELKLPNLKVKSGAVQYDDYTREGWSRRGVRSRLDRRRSLKEALKRRAVQARRAAVHERRLALSAARDAPPARHRGRRVLRDGRVVEHDRARPQAREDVLLLGRAGAAPPVHAPRGRVRRAHRRGVGVRRSRVLPGQRQRRHGRLDGIPQGARHRDAALRSEPLQHLRLLRVRRRELPQRPRSRAGGADGARRRRELHRLRRDGVDRAAAAAVRDGALVRAAAGARRAPPAATRCRRRSRSGTRFASFFSRRAEAEV